MCVHDNEICNTEFFNFIYMSTYLFMNITIIMYVCLPGCLTVTLKFQIFGPIFWALDPL